MGCCQYEPNPMKFQIIHENPYPSNHISTNSIQESSLFGKQVIDSEHFHKKDKSIYSFQEHSSYSIGSKYRPIINKLMFKNKSTMSLALNHK